MQEIVKIQSGKDLLKSFSNEEKPREVFGKYIHDGELCILFGDSNAGKSILANDIAFFVSGGGHEWPDMVSPNIPSLYIDMEMTGKQFAARYNGACDYITELYSRAEVGMTTDDKWSYIKSQIILMQKMDNAPKFIILDNITNGFGSIFSKTRMLELISDMKSLKERFGLTILIIAHCPKRNKKKPITDNDLGGTKMIMNFVDSAFAVGTSIQDESIRYIKQIKARVEGKDGKVWTVRIKSEPYLSFHYIDTTDEDIHLTTNLGGHLYYEMTPEQEISIVELLMKKHDHNEQYISYYDIADKLGLPSDVVIRYDYDNYVRQGYGSAV